MIKITQMSLLLALAIFSQSSAIAENPIKGKAISRTFKIPTGANKTEYLPGVIVVKIDPAFRNSVSKSAFAIPALQQTMQTIGASSVKAKFPNAKIPTNKFTADGSAVIDISLIYEVDFNSAYGIENAINELLKSPEVLYAEPHYIYAPSYKPNDPDTLGTKNYYLKITKAYEAWEVTKGDTNVVIAIIDSGSDLDHPDLAANQVKNYGDPINGIDDDNDGFIDNFSGWDFAGANFNTITGDNNANCLGGNNNHGSHVSGDASAVADNGVGIAGIGFKSRLLTIKCSADNDSRAPGGVGYILTGYEGIIYAADQGADVINCSWGGGGGGQFGQDAVNYATQNGSLVVAAAGNNNSPEPHFPSAFTNVLSVASTTSADRKSGFSNYGNTIDVSAPGSGIYSTLYNNSYASFDGTSMASPIAAGAAALVKSVFPNYTPTQIGEQLRVTCDDIDSKNVSFKSRLGKGRINVLRAVTDTTSPSIRSKNMLIADNTNGGRLRGDTITITADLTNYLRPTSNLTATVSLYSPNTAITLLTTQVTQGAIPTLTTVPLNGAFSFVVNQNAPEDAALTLKITYSDGSYSDFELISIVVNVSTLNITVNDIKSTATGIGRIGFADNTNTRGLGFVYKNTNMIYEGALMIGVSPTEVPNCARNEGATPDDNFPATTRVAKIAQSGIDFLSSGVFTDANASPAVGLEVSHREMAWNAAPDNKYAIFEYKIKNTSANILSNVYPGMFFDWDINASSNNRTAWDGANNMGYAFSTTATDPWAGVKVLNTINPAAPAFYPQSYELAGDPQENGYSIAEKYLTLSSGVAKDSLGFVSATGNDVMFSIGAGPYTISPGAEIVFALAIIGGDSLADLQTSAQAAQVKYTAFITTGFSANEELSSDLTTFPNPTNTSTEFSFSLKKDTKTSLIIYNQLGQQVQVVLNKKLSAGKHSITANVNDLAIGVYNLVLTTENQAKAIKLIVQ